LQQRSVAFNEVKAGFDTVIEDYPALKAYLEKGAQAVNNQDFDPWMVKNNEKEVFGFD